MLACANPFAPQAIPTVAVLPTLPPIASETPTLTVTTSATPVRITLTAHIDRWYQALYPVGWQVSGGYLPNEQNFTPAEQPEYGIRVRFEGTGYSFSVLDALINSELEAMRQEGLAPQEVAIRRAEELAAGEAAGRSADFLGTIGTTPVRLQVTAVVANFTAAYVIRLWAPLVVYDTEGYADAFARAVREFTPLYTPEATATFLPTPTETPPPSETPTPLPGATSTLPPDEPPTLPPATPTDTPALPATAAAPTTTPTPAVPTLGAEPYRAATFLISYPDKWVPTNNIDGSVTFLTNDPTLLVGISVSMIEGVHDPNSAAPALLNSFLAEVSDAVPGVVVGDQRVEENAGDQAHGLSATYVVPYSGGRLVYRVTTLIAADGTAYRLVQWAPESLYEAGYRDLYRAVVAAFRPVAAESAP